MIRTFIGLFMVFGAVGGLDNATNEQIIPLMLIAVVGLALMYFGTNKLNAK